MILKILLKLMKEVTMNNLLKHIATLLLLMLSSFGFSQENEGEGGLTLITNVNREVSPAFRITENPKIIDTIVPIPNIEYPLLNKSMKTSITVQGIEPSKIKIVDKLEKLYPGYLIVGLGNYTMPMGELYYNSTRNRRSSYGIHAKHLSAFGKIKDYAPSQFDNTNAKIFGDFYLKDVIINTEANWLNHGYHYYGILNDSIPKDSLKNRVGYYGGKASLSNFVKKDSGKLLYKINLDYGFFHEFLQDSAVESTNARENNLGIGTNLSYKHELNVFKLDADFRFNNYKFGESDPLFNAYKKDEKNHLIHFRPTISSYRLNNKLRAEVGFDLNFDLAANTVFKPLVVANAKYELLNGMFIPYAGIDGGVDQTTYYSLNRGNEFINSSVDLKNTKTFKIYAGIKGTLSKTMSFDINFHSSKLTDKALYFNDTIFSDQYKFNVLYDDINVLGIGGSISYQKSEKLKIDAIGKYNNYQSTNQQYAWYLPEFEFTLRGNYNLYDKIYIKADFNLQTGRKNPRGILNPDVTLPQAEQFSLSTIADANLHVEYRYNKRISAFVQFNNIANQKYMRWYNYPVYGFQVLGGVTLGF
jgi:hypothetical protein